MVSTIILIAILFLNWLAFLRFSIVTEKEVLHSYVVYQNLLFGRYKKKTFINHPITYIKLKFFFSISSSKSEGFKFYSRHVVSERYHDIVKHKENIIQFCVDYMNLVEKSIYPQTIKYICLFLFVTPELKEIEKRYVILLAATHMNSSKTYCSTFFKTQTDREEAIQKIRKELES